MALPLYLAMIAAEFVSGAPLPKNPAWMACHFSSYATGLSNLPRQLPPGSALILNDRTPIGGHDPELIANTLEQLSEKLQFQCILMDMERPKEEKIRELLHALTQKITLPIGISRQYADEHNGPVFLPPVPIDTTVEDYLAPWHGREVWLEVSQSAATYILTEKGCTIDLPEETEGFIHTDDKLHCHYHIRTSQDIRFTLWRTAQDLTALMEDAENHGASLFFGLYQELGGLFPAEAI